MREGQTVEFTSATAAEGNAPSNSPNRGNELRAIEVTLCEQ
jgi:hypothetical protein